LFAAGGALITEPISLSLLYKAQKTNLNIKGAYWHILQTFAGSLIIIVAALTIWFTDFLEIDPLLGMAFGLLLL
ncbi:MAG TPA: zinc ABC transporter, partial [Dehalococcoidia bacterium]|nr:zinc ABC transporter [Dehalococcoidia bacterium]